MALGTDSSIETLQDCSCSGAESTGASIRLTAAQSRATAGPLEWLRGAADRRHHDQEWAIANPICQVLDLDCDPNDDQYDSALSIIGELAARLETPTRAAFRFSVDEQLLVAALLDYAFYKDDVHDRQQWSIEGAAEALYPKLEDAPNAAQYDRAYRLLREARARLEPLPKRPEIRVGDALLADDLEELEENENGYEIVAVSELIVTVRDADGVDHEVSRSAIEEHDATVVRYFGDFETQPTDPAWVEEQRRRREESTHRWVQFKREERAREFAAAYEQPHSELGEINAGIRDCESLVSGFRSGRRSTGDVERSVAKQQKKIATLEAARAETMQRIAAQYAELLASTDPRIAAVVGWQTATDAVFPLAQERNAALEEVNARLRAARAAGDSEADTVYHRDWGATVRRYEAELAAASDRRDAAFQRLVELCS